MKTKPRRVLIITSSGGGGCLLAAVAKEQELLAENPAVVIAKRDMIKDWYWKAIGRFAVFAWNGAQRRGRVGVLQTLGLLQRAADPLFWVQIFVRALVTIYKEDVDLVIDTQPLGTSAVLLAIRIYNRHRKKQVFLEKVVVDLPTERNTHFFRPIKNLSSNNRRFLRMITIPPLVKEGQTADDFWRLQCNMPESDVVYQFFAIRRAFRKFQGKKREEGTFSLKVQFSSPEEKRFFAHSTGRGRLQVKIGEKSAAIAIEPNDRVFTILLGSQPCRAATLSYVKQFLSIANESGTIRTPVHLFVFCGHHLPKSDSLLREVTHLVWETQNYPSHVTVVPLGFQNEETVAPVFYRSDLTCTRSGGQTAMELMCVMSGEIWIHSEAKKPPGQKEDLTQDQLLKGIPGWEAGSAVYLQTLWKAKIVTPETFADYGRKLLIVN